MNRLSESYYDDLFNAKCDLTFLHAYDVYGDYSSGEAWVQYPPADSIGEG